MRWRPSKPVEPPEVSAPVSPLRVCLAAAPGGHLEELLRLGPAYASYPHFFVINESASLTRTDMGCVYVVPDYGSGNRVQRLLRLALMVGRCLRIWWRERPSVVLTTGPLTGFPIAVMVRLSRGSVIFIECSAQVTEPSRSGRLFRKIAHRFYVQWPALVDRYPKAEYKGLLL